MIAVMALFTAKAEAYSIALEVTNATSEMVKPLANLSYESKGEMHWQDPLPTMNALIAPKGKNIPIDSLKTNLQSYNLEYMDFQDMDKHILAVCLSNYFSIREDALIRFILLPVPGEKHRYHCERQVFKRHPAH